MNGKCGGDHSPAASRAFITPLQLVDRTATPHSCRTPRQRVGSYLVPLERVNNDLPSQPQLPGFISRHSNDSTKLSSTILLRYCVAVLRVESSGRAATAPQAAKTDGKHFDGWT